MMRFMYGDTDLCRFTPAVSGLRGHMQSIVDRGCRHAALFETCRISLTKPNSVSSHHT
jgi:hypothetical protein